jgi:hypothetical protein
MPVTGPIDGSTGGTVRPALLLELQVLQGRPRSPKDDHQYMDISGFSQTRVHKKRASRSTFFRALASTTFTHIHYLVMLRLSATYSFEPCREQDTVTLSGS